MELTYAFLARAAQFSEDGGLGVIGGDLQSLQGTMPFSPDSLTLVAKLECGQDEGGRHHVFRVKILSPGGRRIAQTDLEFDTPRAEGREKMGAILLIDLTEVQFTEPGEHQVVLVLNDAQLKTLEMVIFADVVATQTAVTGR